MHLFARNEEANKWLSEHPMVLGAGAVVIALILIGIGIMALVTKRARSKVGTELKGGQAQVLGFVWLGFGAPLPAVRPLQDRDRIALNPVAADSVALC